MYVPAVVSLTGAVTTLHTPLPGRPGAAAGLGKTGSGGKGGEPVLLGTTWPPPNPGAMPPADVTDFVGIGITSAQETPHEAQLEHLARERDVHVSPWSGSFPGSTTYVGYVRPPEPSFGVTKRRIPGWPDAVLLDDDQVLVR